MYRLGLDQMEGDISEGRYNNWKALKAIVIASQQPWTSVVSWEASLGKVPAPSPCLV